MKDLTKQAVQTVAETLMAQNGQTTTLEVKIALRTNGFFATQQAVSEWMDELSNELPWEYDATGPFRVYRLKSVLNQQLLNVLFSVN